jgi:hypothetical protein
MRSPLSLSMSRALPTLIRPRGILVLGILLLLGLGASAGFFRWAAKDVSEGIIGELSARPSVPAEQLDLWLLYGEPQIQNRLTLLRYSSGLPALLTHVAEPEVPGQPARVYGIDLRSQRPARVSRAGLTVEVRVGAPQHLADGPLTGEGADRVPRAAAGLGADAGRPFAQGVIEWALAPLIGALPGDIAGAQLAVFVEDEPFIPPGIAAGMPASSPRARDPRLAMAVMVVTLLGLAVSLVLASRRGRRASRAEDRATRA